MHSTSDDETFGVVEATVGEIHDAIEAGEITVAWLVDRYLARIEAYDEDLNAILTVNEDAHERARQLDDRFEKEGFTGPLHGIPVVLKDNTDTHDLPTTLGAPGLAEAIPSRDAFVVERLREAGAVILAKANLQELSLGVDTISGLGGETQNAYALDRRPSGSSGGTAAAVAANLGAIGTGTDTCSSNRSPPAFHSLVGLRPTRGLISRTGIGPLSETQDTAGPITRTVVDAARMLDVMAGYDPADSVTAKSAGNLPEDGYLAHLDPNGLDGARIGVVREFFGLHDEDSASEAVGGQSTPEAAGEESAPEAAAAEEVTAAVEGALAEMEAAGATIVDPVEIIDRELLDTARVIHYEFARDLDQYLADRGEIPYDTLAELVEDGGLGSEIESRITEGGYLDVDAEALDENTGYLRRLQRRRRIEVDTLARMADQDLDALAYPPSTIPPVEIPEKQPFEELNCELAAHTGLPALVFPAGFTDDGLPVGIELLGRPFSESQLFELAYAYEQETHHRQPPEGFGRLD